ncbi:MAG: hypothetical protein ACXWDN_19625, partial [Limisphaerales bacterium]
GRLWKLECWIFSEVWCASPTFGLKFGVWNHPNRITGAFRRIGITSNYAEIHLDTPKYTFTKIPDLRVLRVLRETNDRKIPIDRNPE